MREDIRIDDVLGNCGKDMSGPTDRCERLNEDSRSNEVMLAKHLPAFRNASPPGSVLSRGVLPSFLDPSAGIKILGGSFRVVFFPIPVD